MRIVTVVAWLAAALACCPQAWSQTLYKSVKPDGSVEYSDKPSRDAVKIERYEVVPESSQDAEKAAARRADDQRRLREFEDRERRHGEAFDRAEDEIKAALEGLRLAQQRLEAGTEPQPGEVSGTAGRFARLNDAYRARIQALNDALAEAQRRLDRAYAARNALRD